MREFGVGLDGSQSKSPWEIKRDEILSPIGRKVDVILDLRRVIGSVTLEDTPSKVGVQLNSWFNQVVSSFSPETQEGFTQHRKIEKELVELQGKRPSAKNVEEISSRSEIQGRLAENPDVLFLLNMAYVVQDLIGKNETIHNMKDDLRTNFPEVPWKNVRDTLISPFSITFIVDKDFLGKGIRGRHWRETPLSFVADNLSRDEKRHTVKHEEIHNVLDGAQSIGEQTSVDDRLWRTQSRIKRYFELKKLGAPNEILQDGWRMVVDILSPFMTLNSLHEEILAGIESAVRLDFGDSDIGSSAKLAKIIGDKFLLTTGSLATAGNRATKWNKFLMIEHQIQTDPEVRQVLEKAGIEFRKLFNMSIDSARKALAIASRTEEETEIVAHTLLYILPPAKFKHALRYLNYRYGDGISQAVSDIEKTEFIMKKDFTVGSLEKMIAHLQEDPNFLPPEDIKSFKTNIGNFLPKTFSSLKMYREYREMLKQLSSLIGPFNHEEDCTFYVQITDAIILNGTGSNGFKIYQSLNEEEKQEFEGWLVIIIDDLIYQGAWETREEFLQSKEAQNLLKCDFTEIVIAKAQELFKE